MARPSSASLGRKSGGLEADESYCIGTAKEHPDLAIEIVETSGSIDKLEIYRRLAVPEVWNFGDGRFTVFALEGRPYVEQAASRFFPELDLARLATIVMTTEPDDQPAAVRQFRRALLTPPRRRTPAKRPQR